jgi:RecT family.
MASKLSVEPTKLLDTLKATVFKGASNEELLALVVVANRYQLDPLLKEIYAFPSKGGITPIVSVDGWIKMVNRHPDLDGIDFEFQDDQEGKPFSVTCILHLKHRTHPVRVTEYFDECVRNTDPWNKMPRRMLRHKALCQAARIAFGFSGIHDEDEAIDIVSTVTEQSPPPTKVLIEKSKPAATPASTPTANGGTHQELSDFLDQNEIPFGVLVKWLDETGNVENATSYPSIFDLPEKDVKRLLKSKVGLLNGLNEMKQKLAAV